MLYQRVYSPDDFDMSMITEPADISRSKQARAVKHQEFLLTLQVVDGEIKVLVTVTPIQVPTLETNTTDDSETQPEEDGHTAQLEEDGNVPQLEEDDNALESNDA